MGLINSIHSLIKRIILYGLMICFFCLGLATYVVVEIFYGDSSQLKMTSILTKLEEQTTIYFDDETTAIGSIFSDFHRKYTPISQIPAHIQNSIIAAEDKNFYLHYGVDFLAVAAAFSEGIKNKGRFRRGGSTLTQQTVKNIMGDWEASFARKFREMIKAFQLENLYDKKQILEFYLNQFHVAGNGIGIGIASQYYFNKEVKDINLIEAAFIAGSVKSPSRYNPFIKRDKSSYQKAIDLGFKRKNYVLSRMRAQGWIDDQEYHLAIQQKIPFNRGKFITSDVTLVRLVKQHVLQKEVLDKIGLNHPSQLRTSGYKIFTTINKELQNIAQRVTRRNLARLETILSGFSLENVENYKDLRVLSEGSFAFGKVTAINGDNVKNYSIELSFGLPTATIPNQSLQRFAKLLFIANDHQGGYRPYIKQVIDQISVGDILFVEIKKFDQVNLHGIGELYRYPEISGGLMALDKGNVKAVVSGFDTLGFHRAVQAKRQPGSVFKVPTLLSAFQLRWSLLDRIGNERRLFSYQGQHYFPRPDHDITFSYPSIIWSGIMSENLAFINLAFNLLNKLNYSDFVKLLDSLDLTPKKNESPANYHYRLGRKIGVQVNNLGVKKRQLYNATKDLEPDLIISRNDALAKSLYQLWWGDGYAPLIQKLMRENREYYSLPEIKLRLRLTRNNFLRYHRLKQFFQLDWSLLSSAVKEHGHDQIVYKEQYIELLSRFSKISINKKQYIAYHMVFPDEQYSQEDNEPYLEKLRLEKINKLIKKGDQDIDPDTFEDDQEYQWPVAQFNSLPDDLHNYSSSLSLEDIKGLWDSQSSSTKSVDRQYLIYDRSNIYFDGVMPNYMLEDLTNAIDSHTKDIKDNNDRYSLAMYYEHHDFRVAVGLYYISQLSRLIGVDSQLSPVLSSSLGTNVVSVSDVAKLFQTFAQGRIYKFFQSNPQYNQLNFIKRIEDRLGNVLYDNKGQSIQVIDQNVIYQLLQVLRKVVTHGTGKRANGELFVNVAQNKARKTRIRIPAYGKTGTTNDFTTSYFAGFVPYPVVKGSPLDLNNFYTLATYVGYDVPKEMTSGRVSIYGSSGALPLWTDFFKEVIDQFDYSDYVDQFDLDLIDKKEWSDNLDHRYWDKVTVDFSRGVVLGKASERYIEDYKSTDLAETGEDFQDQFKIGESFKGHLDIPKPFNSSQPIPRSFAPISDKTIKAQLEKLKEYK